MPSCIRPPIKPSRSRKQRNVYFSFSTSFSVAVLPPNRIHKRGDESLISRRLVAFAVIRNRKPWEHYIVVNDRNIEALRTDSLSYESRLARDEAFQSVHLDCQLADSAAVDSIFFARLIVMLHPLMAYCVSVLVSCVRDSDCSYAPHGANLLCFW